MTTHSVSGVVVSGVWIIVESDDVTCEVPSVSGKVFFIRQICTVPE